MCNAVSGITQSSGVVCMPDTDQWDHPHKAIAKKHGIPDGIMGDSAVRWKITPKDGDYHSDPMTWEFKLDEKRTQGWWKEDAIALEDSARQAVVKYMASMVPDVAPNSPISTSGDSSNASTAGEEAPALAVGRDSMVRSGPRGVMICAERDQNWKLIALGASAWSELTTSRPTSGTRARAGSSCPCRRRINA